MVGLPTSPPDDPGLNSDQENMVDVIWALCEADLFNTVSNAERVAVFEHLAAECRRASLDDDAHQQQLSIERALER